MQRKLDSFFQITTKYDETNKKCFIYNPSLSKAFFATKPESGDQFVSIKCNVRLFYRPLVSKDELKNITIPKIDTEMSVPLLKSNLQKAIRRCNVSAALSSTIVLLEKDPIAFLRRLPILFVEDVCLLDSFPIVIWLMMSDSEYKLTNKDKWILLDIVQNLCNQMHYYDDSEVGNNKYEPPALQDQPHCNELLSIYYRTLYGGMKCDIQLLEGALHYYFENPGEIRATNFTSALDLLPNKLILIPESIDFHPFPFIIKAIQEQILEQQLNLEQEQISKQEQITESDIKRYIWFAESAINCRKTSTQMESSKHTNTVIWHLIKPELNKIRRNIIVKQM